MISVFNESSLRQRMNSSKSNRSKKDINTFVYKFPNNLYFLEVASISAIKNIDAKRIKNP